MSLEFLGCTTPEQDDALHKSIEEVQRNLELAALLKARRTVIAAAGEWADAVRNSTPDKPWDDYIAHVRQTGKNLLAAVDTLRKFQEKS